MSSLRITLLGGFQVQVDARVLGQEAWRRRQAATLVKLLALAPGHRLHREQLLDTLWPDSSLEAARNSLNQTLHIARSILAPESPRSSGLLSLRADMVSLSPDTPIWVDVNAFLESLTVARRDRDLVRYDHALDLYTGQFLPEDRFEEWATEPRETTSRLWREAVVEAAALAAAHGNREQALARLDALLRTDPTWEDAHVMVMQLYAELGRVGDAFSQYDRLVEALDLEIGVQPRPETTRLRDEIRSGEVGRPAMPLLSPEAPSEAGSNLAAEATSFVGRQSETADLRNLLTHNRIVTVVGGGGCGKTRVALNVGSSLLAGYPDGVWIVELAEVQDPKLVRLAVARVLSIPEPQGGGIEDAIVEALRARRLLLLLDNCEHLVEACAATAGMLIRRCPGVRLLCTSREPLRISGEVVFRLSPLSVPPLEAQLAELLANESIQLFRQRATSVNLRFNVDESNAADVASICRKLDGIPLALEFAAARMGSMTPAQVQQRLELPQVLAHGPRDLPARQHTLEAALDWSYDLLSEAEQRLFRSLSVFVGGFGLDAVEAVCSDATTEVAPIATTLAQLVEKSLVVAEPLSTYPSGGYRYRLLEPVREYAGRLLVAEKEHMLGYARHADWFARFAASADAEVWGPRSAIWMAQLNLELPNLRRALEWSVQPEADPDLGGRLVAALWQVWNRHGSYREARDWLDRVLSRPDAGGENLRAGTLLIAHGLALKQAEYGDQTAGFAATSLSSYKSHGDVDGVRQATRALAIQACLASRFDDARRMLTSVDNDGDSANPLDRHTLAIVEWSCGRLAESLGLLAEASELLTNTSYKCPHVVATCMLRPCTSRIAYGSLGKCLTVTEEMWFSFRKVSAAAAVATIVGDMGTLARVNGNFERAEALLSTSVDAFRAISDDGYTTYLAALAHLRRDMARYADARKLLESGLGPIVRDRVQPARARWLNNLGVVAFLAGDFERAGRDLREALDICTRTGSTLQIIATRTNQGHLALFERSYESAVSIFGDVVNLSKPIPNRHAHADYLRHLGIAELLAGDGNGAAHLSESAELCRAIGHKHGESLARRTLDALIGSPDNLQLS